jgi:hypothetical protein
VSGQADVVQDKQVTNPPTQWPPPAEDEIEVRRLAARKHRLRQAVALVAAGAAVAGFAGYAVLAGSLAALAAVGALTDVLTDG